MRTSVGRGLKLRGYSCRFGLSNTGHHTATIVAPTSGEPIRDAIKAEPGQIAELNQPRACPRERARFGHVAGTKSVSRRQPSTETDELGKTPP
jgi:hypothetical protein